MQHLVLHLSVDGDIAELSHPSKNKALERVFELGGESNDEVMFRIVCRIISLRVFMVVAVVHLNLVCMIPLQNEFAGGVGRDLLCGGGMRDKDAYYISQLLVRKARMLLPIPARVVHGLSGCQNKSQWLVQEDIGLQGRSPPWVACWVASWVASSWESGVSSIMVALGKHSRSMAGQHSSVVDKAAGWQALVGKTMAVIVKAYIRYYLLREGR